ncbi:hypothetical protein SADO_01080 [Salinisphaera dokdonensis CL-ES53]|jgi:hypothetical protein|uniref:Lipoprotein n=1 Tax=Salinisphaera dokdonensis CL-ES53 TaxID=1304272 RepID=A0ABV2AW08_9GAMM
MRRSFLKVFGLALAVSVLAGCTTLFVSGDDSQCARDLAEVENAAAAARRALAEGVSAENRQPMLDLLVDAADHARASCGYERPDTPSSDRARKPKAG